MTGQPTATLATFFSGLSRAVLPDRVAEATKDLLLDALACALAGRHDSDRMRIEALAECLGGPKETTVFAGPPQSLAGATLVNGYQIAASTTCDIHRPTHCSMTPEVVPPALAVAEQRHIGGRELLVALAAGLETAVRVGIGINYPAMRARGWHAPGVIGPFGAAAAVARLLEFDANRFQNALSLAGTQAAGTFAQQGTPTILFHQSRGAYSGLLAALLAETGFKAGPEILVAAHGGLFNLYSDGGDPEATVAGLGEEWLLETISLRMAADPPEPMDHAAEEKPARGMDRPSRQEIVSKFRKAAEEALGAERAARALDLLLGLDDLPDVSVLTATLAGRAPARS